VRAMRQVPPLFFQEQFSLSRCSILQQRTNVWSCSCRPMSHVSLNCVEWALKKASSAGMVQAGDMGGCGTQ
jgi:hypothetical protein